jgi:hypothetical protein
MFSHPLKAAMRVGDITAAGLGIKRVRLSPEQLASPGQGNPDSLQKASVWKVWVAVLIFLGLLAAIVVLTA